MSHHPHKSGGSLARGNISPQLVTTCVSRAAQTLNYLPVNLGRLLHGGDLQLCRIPGTAAPAAGQRDSGWQPGMRGGQEPEHPNGFVSLQIVCQPKE